MKNYRVLVVEDEQDLAELLRLNLEIEGYKVALAPHGAIAIQKLKSESFDLVIMDIMMPKMDGFTAIQHVRLTNNDIPIMILSASNQSQDRIKGLKSGADDYLSKPFELEELLLRVDKLIRRTQKDTTRLTLTEYSFGSNKVDFSSYAAVGVQGEFKLTKKESQLLKLLIEKKNEVVTREEILKTVWGYTVFPSTRTIDNFILAFRKYFEEDPKNPSYFLSLRGVGYKFSINE
ncbi:MAG: response regulator transcription factor [Bacteroidetes bacterium]|nr:response regulator transcription factor [Bacteroidota bacterium]MDA0943349.1 response regulator transcription factor [Bacteroidota bacterium]MDA1111037.1 response regulator transcription factor [Bacteroidota bacterium]